MDPFLWAYGLMARETAGDEGPRDPELLRHYRATLDLTLVDTESLVRAEWSEAKVPECSKTERLDILRALAAAVHDFPGGWPAERARLVHLAERFGLSPIETAGILTPAAAPPRARRRRRLDRRALLLAGGATLGTVGAIGLGLAAWDRRSARKRFAGFAESFADTLLLIELECDLLLGTGRVSHHSLGMGFFVSRDGAFVTSKQVVEPWKFVGELVRKIDGGYVLDRESVRIRAWPQRFARLADRGRFSAEGAFQTDTDALRLVRMPPDRTAQRSVALAEGGVHRGEYHALDESNLALLKADVTEDVEALRLAPADVEKSERVVVLGLTMPRRRASERRVTVRSSPGRVSARGSGAFRLTAAVPQHCSGGPVLDEDGLVVGVAANGLGDARGANCVPAGAVRSLLEG